MVDDKTKTAADRKRIDVNEAYELTYWSAKFGVTKEQLKAAIQKVGPIAEDVARKLAGTPPVNPG